MNSSDTVEYQNAISEAGEFIKSKLGVAKIALVLGSGLGPFVENLIDTKELDFKEIPHMPSTAVVGHKGKMILGSISGKRILCLAGRIHPYEGYHFFLLTFVCRVMKYIGVELYISTNSSGGCQPGMKKGCIMVTRDHINWFKRNPLLEVPELSERHVDMRQVYSTRLISLARRTAKAEGVQLFEGVAITTSGPTYESFTEVEVGSKFGASAFGMSLIPESMVAYSQGLEVMGCSMITNIAAGIDDSSMELTHEDVIGVSGEFAPQFTKFMLAFISNVESKPVNARMMESYNTESKMPDSLPQPQAPLTKRQQVKEAVDFVKGKVKASFDLQRHVPEVAVFVCHGMENLAAHLKKQKTVAEIAVDLPFRDVPHFPCITRSGKQGRIAFAAHLHGHNSPVIFLHGSTLESFNVEEGIFVALLLEGLGVEKLVFTLLAGGASPAMKSDTVRIIGDATDFTTISAVAQIKNQPQYMSQRLFNSNCSDLEALKLAFKFAGQDDSSMEVNYMHILGPSFPTRAEMNHAGDCGMDLVGITSLTLVTASRSLGLDVVGIAGVAFEAGAECLPDASYVLWSKMRNIIDCLFKGTYFPKRRSEQESKIRLERAGEDPERSSQVTFQLAQPVSQGSLEDVKESTKFLLEKGVFMDADFAIVLDSRIPLFDIEMESKIMCSYDQIPKFPKHAKGNFISITTPQKKKLIVLHGTLLLNEGWNNAQLGHSIRVLQQLKVKRVLLINEVCSYSPELPLDSFVLLRDHVNLAGRNPLYGKNVPEFGIRFADLGNLYTDTLRQAVRRCAQQLDVQMDEATCAYVVGPVFTSLADAEMIRAYDCDVSCTGMIPEVIVARHAGIPLTAIGVVKSCIANDVQRSHKGSFKGRNSHLLASLVTSLLSRLQ